MFVNWQFVLGVVAKCDHLFKLITNCERLLSMAIEKS